MDPIVTPRLILRPFEDTDFEAVHEYASDPVVTRYQTWGPNSEADTRAFISRAREALESPAPHEIYLAIVERSLIGGCGLKPGRVEHREYEIGYSLNPRFWRQGLGREAVTHLLDFAFGSVGAHRVFAYIDPLNHASIRLAEKVGLRREGHLVRDVCIEGEWRDTLVYAVLEDEFESGRKPCLLGARSGGA
jgi:RimJ/RimL family protein N-acetyltransferase